MNRRDIGRLHRILRQRARLTQEELAARAGVARWKVVRLEANDLDHLRVRDIEACLGAVGARLTIDAYFRGAASDRLLDDLHAAIVGACVRALAPIGWETHVEISFNDYGDRGSIDLLAWHAQSHTLLILEIKSELAGIEGLLRPFDVKCRLAPGIAAKRFGWQARNVAKVLVLPSERTCRRQVERHADVLRAALPASAADVRKWLRRPAGPISGIWFVTDVQQCQR